MSQTLSMRAMSVGASGLLLGALAIAGVSMSFRLNAASTWKPPGIPVVIDEPPPPPLPPATPDAEPPPPLAQPEPAPYAPPIPTPAPPVAFPLSPAPAPAGPVTIADPHWLARPHDLDRYYPARALRRGVEGAAVLDCLVSTAGLLRCAVVSETPQGWGFGEAALAISRDHRMAPARRDGVAVEGRYRMRVPFRVNHR